MKRWTVADVMSRDVITVAPEAGFHEVADLLVTHGVSAVPVVDGGGVVVGVVSEADLLGKLEYADRVPHHALALRRMRSRRAAAPGDTAAQLMSSPAVTIHPDASVSVAARLIDAARVKRLPVLDDAGRLVGIVSRRDLVRLYARADAELTEEIRTNLLDLGIDQTETIMRVSRGVVTLRGRFERRSTAVIAVDLVSATPGVLDVIDELTFIEDDAPATTRHPLSRRAGPTTSTGSPWASRR
jgi:CBS domain-containing protein